MSNRSAHLLSQMAAILDANQTAGGYRGMRSNVEVAMPTQLCEEIQTWGRGYRSWLADRKKPVETKKPEQTREEATMERLVARKIMLSGGLHVYLPGS